MLDFAAPDSVLPTAVEARPRGDSTLPSEPAVNAAVVEVIDLFAGPLEGVRFPALDGDVLRAAATAVEAIHKETQALEQQLLAKKHQLEAAQMALNNQAQKAVAYARVFAIGNDALMARLDGVVFPRPSPREARAAEATAPKRRGRRSAGDGLFAADVAADTEASAT